jgi:excinuclease UvrABC nuclease subunit
MDFGSIEDIERQGFSGFAAVSTLRGSTCRQVPEASGVYLIIRPQPQPPIFLDHSTGGHFRGQEPDVAIQELQQAWVPGAIVIYIGKATVLRNRLRSYMRFGYGEPAPHWGGRYIWQLTDAPDLLVCWKMRSDEKPADVESQLIQEFKTRYGKRPFANLRD